MASPRTRRLIAVEEASRRLNTATRSRRRIQEEAIQLNVAVGKAQARLAEIDEEEEVCSREIEGMAEIVAAAHADPPQTAEPSEAEVSGTHP